MDLTDLPAAHRAGLPCAEVRGLTEVDGRESIVFERLRGPSLWDLMTTGATVVDRAMLGDRVVDGDPSVAVQSAARLLLEQAASPPAAETPGRGGRLEGDRLGNDQ